jgi:hypothetical protein
MGNQPGSLEKAGVLPAHRHTRALANIDRLRLLEAVAGHFSDEELRTLCFELGIDYDDLPAQGKKNRARELIYECERGHRLDTLIALCLQKRPHVDWPAFVLAAPDTHAPFKGLEAYGEADADLFFGRDELIAELVEHLRQNRFLAIVGASGSGKSSVVRAGVLPALKGKAPGGFKGELPAGSASWPVYILTPTAHPLKELATRLTIEAESVRATTQLMDDMAQDARSLDIALSRIASRSQVTQVLIVVDQFEELFTLCRDEGERKVFIDNLITAATPATAGSASIIITLRADFYGHCLQYNALHVLLEQQQKIVGPMTAVEMRQAIVMPAHKHGLTLEPGLVDLLLRDVGVSGDRGPEPGALPLLSHALLETWQRREGNRLTLAGYHAAGGVQAAIAQTADAAFGRLLPEQQTIARNIFLRLTELSEGPQETRRRAALAELIPQGDKAAAVLEVLKRLADARLVTTHQQTAEVAHEVLIREWPTLRRWLDENRATLRLQRQLTEAALAWDADGRDESYLYRGARLDAADSLALSAVMPLSSLERTFLDESQRAQIRRKQQERERQQRTQQSALGAAAGGALGVGIVIWLLYRGLVDSSTVLLGIVFIDALLGAIAGIIVVLMVEQALNAAADGERPTGWRRWLRPALAGVPGLAFLLAGHTVLPEPFTFARIVLAVMQGGLWGAGVGVGRAWLQWNGRPLWQSLIFLVIGWSLLLLLLDQLGSIFSFDGQSAPAGGIAMAGAMVPLLMFGGAALAANGWFYKERVATGGSS